MEELLEVMSWQQLCLHEKPIILVNTNGYPINPHTLYRPPAPLPPMSASEHHIMAPLYKIPCLANTAGHIPTSPIVTSLLKGTLHPPSQNTVNVPIIDISMLSVCSIRPVYLHGLYTVWCRCNIWLCDAPICCRKNYTKIAIHEAPNDIHPLILLVCSSLTGMQC